MTAGLRAFRPVRWGRLLVLLLAGALLVQSGPVSVLVQQMGLVQAPHTCQHCENGICPRNPDASCVCSTPSPAPSDVDGPRLRHCDRDPSEAFALFATPKWAPDTRMTPPAPRTSSAGYGHQDHALAPQRLGDEVFRPPRTTPPVRLS